VFASSKRIERDRATNGVNAERNSDQNWKQRPLDTKPGGKVKWITFRTPG